MYGSARPFFPRSVHCCGAAWHPTALGVIIFTTCYVYGALFFTAQPQGSRGYELWVAKGLCNDPWLVCRVATRTPSRSRWSRAHGVPLPPLVKNGSFTKRPTETRQNSAKLGVLGAPV